MIVLKICNHLGKIARILFKPIYRLSNGDWVTGRLVSSKFPILMKVKAIEEFLDLVKLWKEYSRASQLHR